jgi:MoxR-like ATPase
VSVISLGLLFLVVQFPPSYHPREEAVAELVLGMADVSTNLVMLTGAPGVGRSMLAASLAQELVSTHHWTDAYWIDLQGVNNVVLAGVLRHAAAAVC